jgi:hypothetical protein
MTQQHPISPTPELFAEWLGKAMRQRDELNAKPGTVAAMVADRAAQWGADQELEACVEWLEQGPFGFSVAASDLVKQLRAARRPKPPSLAEQGLKLLEPPSGPVMLGTPEYRLTEFQAQILRAALKRLNELDRQATH